MKLMMSGSAVLLGLNFMKLILGSIDQVFILSVFPKQEFGMYSLGWFVANSASGIAGIYVSIIAPKLMRMAKGGQLKQAHRLVDLSLSAYGLVLLVAFPIGYPILYGFIQGYLPEYASALPLYFIFPAAALHQGINHILYKYYIARDKEISVIWWSIFSVLVAVLLGGAMYFGGFGLKGVLLATITAQGTLNAFMLYRFEKSASNGIQWTKYSLFFAVLLLVAAFYIGVQSLATDATTIAGVSHIGMLSLASAPFIGGVIWMHQSFVKESIEYFWS
jgi:O-antigen/teichoic acid export membrane protein